MKHMHLKTLMGTVLVMLFLGACSDILEEQPRSIYTPDYFKTEKGVIGGLTGMYAHLRYIYGQGYFFDHCQTGTDETTYGQNANANFKDLDLSGVGTLTASSSRSDALWGESYLNINSCCGVIENGTAVGVSNALLAEARFFRAFDFFNLVQTFGGVALDMGAGELKYNTSPSLTSVRNTVPEVYTRAIFPDLLIAINDLPPTGRVVGGVTKTAARFYLAKAYLTYGWWLQNPNNIPTYPETDRVDPDGHNAAWYFQQAYDIATAAIADPGPFGLMPTFYEVYLATKDRNKECILYADHIEGSELYNATSLSYSTGTAPENFASWMTQWNYTLIRSSTDGLVKADGSFSSAKSSVQREAAQAYGRPWTSMAPTIEVLTNTFADKVNDSRYDGTFVTVYRANFQKTGTGITQSTLYNANNMQVAGGGAIFSFLNDEPATPLVYPTGAGKSAIGAAEIPGRSDFVYGPQGINRICYPGLWKIGPYRTDNGTGLGTPNGASTRPFVIARFAELYFIAAEAAVKGATTTVGNTALDLINVVRARAGKWSFDNAGNVAKVADNSAAMIAATPATIDINYILAERSREFYSEGLRWYDLVRTQKWAELSTTYHIGGMQFVNHGADLVTRTIPVGYYIRPIPIAQLDRMIMTAEEKVAYQNPAYR